MPPVNSDAVPSASSNASAIRPSLIIGASLAAWSIGGYLFYLLAGRILGPADYGLAAALQGVIVVIALPAAALQWSNARVIAANADNRAGAVAVYRRALMLGTLLATIGALAAVIVTALIAASGADIPFWPLMATYATFITIVPLALTTGALQGEHRFTGFAWSYGSTGVLRAPVFLALLLLPISAVVSTILSVGIAVVIGVLWAMWLTRTDLLTRTPPPPAMWRDFTRALPVAAIGLGGIAILTNVDVIASKLGIGGDEAGYFGAAAVIAKALLVVPQAMTIILLPRIAERKMRNEPTGSLLAAGVAVMGVAGVLAMLLAIPLSEPITTITFGTAYQPAAELVLPFFGATTLLGALLILVNHHVARSDNRFAWVVGGLAVLQVALLAVFAHSPYAIIGVDASVAGLGLILHEVIYLSTGESMIRGIGAQFRIVFRRVSRSHGGDA